MDFAAAFGGAPDGDDAWAFELPERFNGAFGGTNGGVLTALSVFVARRATGRRVTGGTSAAACLWCCSTAGGTTASGMTTSNAGLNRWPVCPRVCH